MLNSRQYNLILSLASEDKYLPAKHYSQLFSVSEKQFIMISIKLMITFQSMIFRSIKFQEKACS